MNQNWVTQQIKTDDPGVVSVDWDTYNIGVIEDNVFRTIYSCWSEKDAEYLISALNWYSTFVADGVIKEPVIAQPKKKRTPRKPRQKREE